MGRGREIDGEREGYCKVIKVSHVLWDSLVGPYPQQFDREYVTVLEQSKCS